MFSANLFSGWPFRFWGSPVHAGMAHILRVPGGTSNRRLQYVELRLNLTPFELVVNTVSMEEAVQQQLEAEGEFEEPPEQEAPAQ